MKKFLLISLFAFLIPAFNPARAGAKYDISVEDKNFEDASAVIKETIDIAEVENFAKCVFQEKQIQEGFTKIYFVTTKNKCGWSANSAPIWIIEDIKDSFRVVLRTDGYGMNLKKRQTGSIEYLQFTGGSAGNIEVQKWTFDGIRFVRE